MSEVSTRLTRPWPAGFSRVLAVRLLLTSYFFIPYLVLYAASLDISLGLLLVIEAVYALLIVLFDLPAGHLADRIGPRQALLLGAVLGGLATALLGSVAHVLAFWAAQPLFAAAQSLTMGADAALAAGVFRRAGRSGDFEAGERMVASLTLACTAAVLVTASALSLLGLRMTFLATAVAQFAAAALLLGVTDVRSNSDLGERIPLLTRVRQLAGGVRASVGLRIDLFAMVLVGTAFAVLLYLMPVYFVRAGVNQHLVGVAAAAVALLAAGVSYALPGRWTARLTAGFAVLASAMLSIELAAVVLVAAVLLQAAQATLLPRFRARVLDDLRQHGEATAMSIVTTSRNLGFALLTPFIGLLTVWSGPVGLSLLCAGLFLVAGVVMSTRLSSRRPVAGPAEHLEAV